MLLTSETVLFSPPSLSFLQFKHPQEDLCMEFFRSRSFRRRKRDPKSDNPVKDEPPPVPSLKGLVPGVVDSSTELIKGKSLSRRSFPGRSFFGRSSRAIKSPRIESPVTSPSVHDVAIVPTVGLEVRKEPTMVAERRREQVIQRRRSKSAPGQLQQNGQSKIPLRKHSTRRRHTIVHQGQIPAGTHVPCLRPLPSVLGSKKIPKPPAPITLTRPVSDHIPPQPQPASLPEIMVTPQLTPSLTTYPSQDSDFIADQTFSSTNVEPSQSLALDELLASYAYTTTGLLRDQSCPFGEVAISESRSRSQLSSNDDHINGSFGDSSWSSGALKDEAAPFGLQGCASFYSARDLSGLGLKMNDNAPWTAPATSTVFRKKERIPSYRKWDKGSSIEEEVIDDVETDAYGSVNYHWPLPPRLLIDGERSELRRLKKIEYLTPQSQPSSCESRHILRFSSENHLGDSTWQQDIDAFYQTRDVEVTSLSPKTIADLALSMPCSSSSPQQTSGRSEGTSVDETVIRTWSKVDTVPPTITLSPRSDGMNGMSSRLTIVSKSWQDFILFCGSSTGKILVDRRSASQYISIQVEESDLREEWLISVRLQPLEANCGRKVDGSLITQLVLPSPITFEELARACRDRRLGHNMQWC